MDSVVVEQSETKETMIDGEISPQKSSGKGSTKPRWTESMPHDLFVPIKRKTVVVGLIGIAFMLIVITMAIVLPKDRVTGPSSEQLVNVTPPSANNTTKDETKDEEQYVETFVPGNLTRLEVGLLLSEGLRARIIATSGKPVKYHDGNFSTIPFHGSPDFGATFPDTRPFNEGGWVYTSNSEMKEEGQGGVGSLTFNKEGNIIDYRMVLQNTTMNCGGGSTPWGTWMSCEEVEDYGEIYQVDPFGEIPAQPATIGSQLGRWESFAYDVRDPQDPKFFATEDHNKGTVRRFRPEKSMIDWDNPWNMLHVNGTIDYLVVYPNENMAGGTIEWVDDIQLAKNNARSFYPQTEGIDVYDGTMYVACKGIRQLFMFDLDTLTYSNHSTVSGLFDGSPDQMKRILDDNPSDLLYFTEEGGVDAGIHARDEEGRYFTILESPAYIDETTGLAFSPDGKHLYVAYQKNGLVFDVWREDGLSFGSKTLNVKYHQATSR